MSAMISIDDELNLAINSSDKSILDKLKRNVNTVVRRALAANIHTPKEILDTLAYDPVLNVSYIAIQNPNCSVSREFNHITHPCIKCSEHIGSNSCTNCNALQEFNAKHGY